MKLVLVHGRAQQRKDPAALRKQWIDALGTNIDEGADVAFAYYGDLLADLVDRVEKELPDDLAARGPATGPHSYLTAQSAILADLVQAAGVTEGEVLEELDMLQARDPQNWGWVLAAARTLSRIPGLDARVIDTWLRDVSLYITNAAVQRAVDQIVLTELDTEPFALVAHSLGTVVAYNVLRSPLRTAPCRGLITLGSPLAIPAIRKRLRAPVTYPPALSNWFNAFDKADIVALRPLDATYFPTDPPIDNYPGVTNPTPDRHGITGYLTDPKVATVVADLLREPTH
ncbi:hypothetical protein [Nocardia wallacei]|uniref:hypothetical protein n=1 Tax=Nocardia wallacei TaxID=480035 RepID=UPI002454FF21|nr:hypothetical protein [Nocardia wallacei]